MRKYRLLLLVLIYLTFSFNIIQVEAMSYREMEIYEEMFNNQGMSEANVWNEKIEDSKIIEDKSDKHSIDSRVNHKTDIVEDYRQETKEDIAQYTPQKYTEEPSSSSIAHSIDSQFITSNQQEVEHSFGDDGESDLASLTEKVEKDREINLSLPKVEDKNSKPKMTPREDKKYIGKMLSNNGEKLKRTYKNTLNKLLKSKIKVVNTRKIDKNIRDLIDKKIQYALFILISYGLYLIYLQNKSKYLFYK